MLVFSASVLVGGCSVLTKSQVAEVSKFADAANSYTALPGAVIKAEADVREARELLDISTAPPDFGWSALIKSRGMSDKTYAAADRADKALGIFKLYGQQLTLLTSDKPATDLDKNAEDLGKSLNSAIGLYNKQFGTSFTELGGWIAAGVSAGGRIYIRHKQEVFLQEYVRKADPMIQKLNKDVARLTETVSDQINGELSDLEGSYKHVVGSFRQNPGGPNAQGSAHTEDAAKPVAEAATASVRPEPSGGIPVSTVQAVRDAYKRANDALKLAPLCRKAASNYAAAHSKLKEALSQKRDLTSTIAEIEALESDLEAANKVRQDLSSTK